MYEASFGLKRRPFAATPDATCFRSSEPIRAALDEIVVCVEHGQGIAVLTAPAGTGKTLLCERLRCELDERFETVFLRHASFLTRRALLQTILCELNSPFHHPSEQELRLELFPAIRALQPKREALVLICDEAHQLSDSLLEELRILADFAESGRPLVRLVLVGQLSLEDKLAQPSLEAFNQRIRAHVSLSAFDHAGSLDYIDYRLTWAGGRTDEVFTPPALELIAQVSDGVPRCINQLADHALLLAFVAEQRPAGEELVLEALNDLRQLPLHWNEPPQTLSTPTSAEREEHFIEPESAETSRQTYAVELEPAHLIQGSSSATYAYEPEPDSVQQDLEAEPAAAMSQYISHDELSFENGSANNTQPLDVSGDDWRRTLELFHAAAGHSSFADSYAHLVNEPSTSAINESNRLRQENLQFQEILSEAYVAAGTSPAAFEIKSSSTWKTSNDSSTAFVTDVSTIQSKSGGFQEEIVVDRYASIDAGFEPPATPEPDTQILNEVRFEKFDYERDHSNKQIDSSLDDTSEELFVKIASLPVTAAASDDRCDLDETKDFQGSVEFAKASAGLQDGYALAANDLGSSDSLLRAIRNEVDQLTSEVNQQSSSGQPIEQPVAAWESVETPIVESKPESRPFQYLFSKLRRKQQGLS